MLDHIRVKELLVKENGGRADDTNSEYSPFKTRYNIR